MSIRTRGKARRLADAAGVRDHAYDAHDRLVVEARRDNTAGLRQVALGGAGEHRYFYDKGGNRILSQEGPTLRTVYAPHSNRWLGQPGAQDTVHYNANGQPRAAGRRAYDWDALGRLAAVNTLSTIRRRMPASMRRTLGPPSIFADAGAAVAATRTWDAIFDRLVLDYWDVLGQPRRIANA